MKAVILAGGSGTRLYPTTGVINKHLLPIYNKPMIYYSLSVVMLIGIREVVLVVNPKDLDSFYKLLGNGSRIGMSIDYSLQSEPLGLADALLSAEHLVREDSVCLVLGDNIFFGHGLPDILKEAKAGVEAKGGAYVFGYYVNDPSRYGIIELDSEGRVVSLEEKPKNPKSNFACVGLYFYDEGVFDIAREVKPSKRGEKEITSVNEVYMREGKLRARILGRGFAWFDAGTHDSFLEAGEFVATVEKKTGLMIGCIEEIAYRNGWIGKEELIKLAEPLAKTDYGRYLMSLLEEDKDAL